MKGSAVFRKIKFYGGEKAGNGKLKKGEKLTHLEKKKKGLIKRFVPKKKKKERLLDSKFA